MGMPHYPDLQYERQQFLLSNKILTLSAAATFMGCSVSTVSRSIRRMESTGDVFDLARTGRPAVYSEACRLKLTGFYCQTRPFANTGKWSLRWGGKSTLRHILKKSVQARENQRFIAS